MIPSQYEGLSDTQLLDSYAAVQGAIEVSKRDLGLLEVEIRSRMSGRGAIAIPSDFYVCELRQKTRYEQVAFSPLKELLSDADLVTCFRPEHSETVYVSDKWDTMQVRALARRYGTQVQRIVDAARVVEDGKLKFEERA